MKNLNQYHLIHLTNQLCCRSMKWNTWPVSM